MYIGYEFSSDDSPIRVDEYGMPSVHVTVNGCVRNDNHKAVAGVADTVHIFTSSGAGQEK
ncbi:MAG TPA: hypothetical protein VNI77_03565 [Nitrososphaera sp.]|nr:hypothetical protein [Nitrososphaera sp.]